MVGNELDDPDAPSIRGIKREAHDEPKETFQKLMAETSTSSSSAMENQLRASQKTREHNHEIKGKASFLSALLVVAQVRIGDLEAAAALRSQIMTLENAMLTKKRQHEQKQIWRIHSHYSINFDAYHNMVLSVLFLF